MNLSVDKCKFADSLVEYLYDEMRAADRGVFEDHLAACEACTDEFAGLSVARFEVFDWKREEFDALVTPQIMVPYPAHSLGWFEGLRAAFSWATVVPAMAALLVMLGAGYLLWSNWGATKAPEVAANVLVTPPAEPIAVKKVEAPVIATVETPSPVDTGSKAEPRPVISRREVDKVRASKMLAPQMKVTPANAPIRANETVASVRNSSRPSPRLTAYNDDDDDSLRLSDLFDEAGPPENR